MLRVSKRKHYRLSTLGDVVSTKKSMWLYRKFGMGRLMEDPVWIARCDKIESQAQEERGGCTSNRCNELQALIKANGGMSRLNTVEGGTELQSKRRGKRERYKRELKEHVAKHHGARKQFRILDMLKRLREIAQWSRRNFKTLELGEDWHINVYDLLDEESLKKFEKRNQMLVNANDLRRRAEMVDVQDDKEPAPNFFEMPSARDTFKQLRPYHVRLKEYECERGLESQVVSQIGSNYKDVGIAFD